MGGYYVTAIESNSTVDRGRVALLVGPLQSHAAALARVADAKRVAKTVNSRAAWLAYGTSRDTAGCLPAGKLNAWFGLAPGGKQ
jgi:hypothetical protein